MEIGLSFACRPAVGIAPRLTSCTANAVQDVETPFAQALDAVRAAMGSDIGPPDAGPATQPSDLEEGRMTGWLPHLLSFGGHAVRIGDNAVTASEEEGLVDPLDHRGPDGRVERAADGQDHLAPAPLVGGTTLPLAAPLDIVHAPGFRTSTAPPSEPPAGRMEGTSDIEPVGRPVAPAHASPRLHLVQPGDAASDALADGPPHPLAARPTHALAMRGPAPATDAARAYVPDPASVGEAAAPTANELAGEQDITEGRPSQAPLPPAHGHGVQLASSAVAQEPDPPLYTAPPRAPVLQAPVGRAPVAAQPAMPPAPDDAVRQLVSAVRLQLRDGIGDAKIRLKPEHLGEVRIELRVDRDRVSAVMHVQRADVRTLIEAQVDVLRAQLAAQGLSLEELLVKEDEHRESRQDARDEPSRSPDRRRRPQSGDRAFVVDVEA